MTNNKVIPASGELEDNREEGSKDCFEIESTKIFTNIVDKLETYYEEKMKIEVVEESKNIPVSCYFSYFRLRS